MQKRIPRSWCSRGKKPGAHLAVLGAAKALGAAAVMEKEAGEGQGGAESPGGDTEGDAEPARGLSTPVV